MVLDDVAGQAGVRDRVVDDHMFTATTPAGVALTTFRLQLFQAFGLRPVVLATRQPGEGTYSFEASLTRHAEAVWRDLLPDLQEPPIWIEHEPIGLGEWDLRLVTFSVEDRFQLSNRSNWPITRQGVEELVGQSVDLDRGEGFIALPDHEPTSVLVVRPIWHLPPPRPFRIDCLRHSTGRRLRQRIRQRWPRPVRRSCCWYHGGDWSNVSDTAVNLLNEAHRAGVPTDEARETILDSETVRNAHGWEGQALRSLFADPILVSDDDESNTELSLINGQHRLQAMLDIGTQRTVMEAYVW